MKIYLILLFPLLCSPFYSNAQSTHLYPVPCGSKYCYINDQGKLATKDSFAAASTFVDNRALVKTTGKNGKWGYIDTTGAFAIVPIYEAATDFSEGIAFVSSQPGTYQAIDENGKVKFTITANNIFNFHDGLAAFSVNGKEPIPSKKYDKSLNEYGLTSQQWGFVNKDGEVVLKPQFYIVSYFSDGLCPVMDTGDNWGYINKQGKVVIPYQYDIAYPFQDSMAVVSRKTSYKSYSGVIDCQNKFIIPAVYKQMAPDGNKIMVKTERWGWMDKHGETIIRPLFSQVKGFGNSKYAPANYNGYWGYINEQGNFIILPKFSLADKWDNGAALAVLGELSKLANVPDSYVVVHKDKIFTSIPFHYSESINYLEERGDIEYTHIFQAIDHQGLIDPEAIKTARVFLSAYYNKDYKTCANLALTDFDRNRFRFLAANPKLDTTMKEPVPPIIATDLFNGWIKFYFYYRTKHTALHYIILGKKAGKWHVVTDDQRNY